MFVEQLSLIDFRSYLEAEFVPAPMGTTVIRGSNGSGKTNLIEAIGYLATAKSIRGAPTDALLRIGAPAAIVRGRIVNAERARRVNIDAELKSAGRDVIKMGGQPLRRVGDLSDGLLVTVFSPDDLELVKGGPGFRRSYIDDLAVSLLGRRASTFAELERVLKQRNSLLRSVFANGWRPGRALPADVVSTLDVWDHKLSEVGGVIATIRQGLADQLDPIVARTYGLLGRTGAETSDSTARVSYRPSWNGALGDALVACRDEDLRRGVTTIGPQRDDLDLRISAMPSRTHASQGEQRTASLALRLAGHLLVTESRGTSPVLLLDDVFSELDDARSSALMEMLPPGQTILTTAGSIPSAVTPAATVIAREGRLET